MPVNLVYLMQDIFCSLNLCCALCGIITALAGCLLFLQIGANDITSNFLIIGAFIVCTAIFGCCTSHIASDSRRRPLIVTYGLLVMLLLFFQINVGLFTVLEHDDILRVSLEQTWYNHTERWTAIETKMKCCGLSGWSDYMDNETNRLALSASCCPGVAQLFVAKGTGCVPAMAYTGGCLKAFQSMYKPQFLMAGYLLLVLSVAQIGALLIVIYLAAS